MSRRGTRSRTRRNLIYTPSQLKSLRKDGKYKSRHINAFSDMGSNYNDIKNTENYQRSLNPNISQKKLAAKTFKIFKEENLGSSSSRRGSSSLGTRSRRGSRRGSSSSGTRSRRGSRSRSNSSGTRSRRSSGTRSRSRSRSRSLHTSDL